MKYVFMLSFAITISQLLLINVYAEFGGGGGSRRLGNQYHNSGNNLRAADQILNGLERKILIENLSDDQEYTFKLKFSENQELDISDSNVYSERGYIKLSKSSYTKLVQMFSHSVAKFVVSVANKPEKIISKVYVADVKVDYNCDHPVLLSDMNGTLDTGDQCTKDVVDRLITNYNLPVFVVSTIGSRAENDLKRIGLENESNVVVLDNRGNGYGSEKAYRILDQVMKAGLCVIGMAGDSLNSDGHAMTQIDFPYFAVNRTRQVREKIEYLEDEPYCVANEGYPEIIENEFDYGAGFGGFCPTGYESFQKVVVSTSSEQRVSRIQCSKYSSDQSFIDQSWSRPRLIEESVIFYGNKKKCPRASTQISHYGSTQKITYKLTAIVYEDQSYEYFENGKSESRFEEKNFCKLQKTVDANYFDECPSDEVYSIKYRKVKKNRWESKTVLDEIDMSEYPVGSDQAINWCELESKIIDRIEEIKNEV